MNAGYLALVGPFLCLLLATSAHADEAVLRDPVFKQSHAYADLGGTGPYYPERAARNGIGGSVTLQCRASAKGDLSDCTVLSVTPTGMSFEEAALLMAKRGWLKAAPHLVDGQPVDGEVVRVVVPFVLKLR